MPTVRSVVFDVGGVLLDWDPRHLYRSLIDDEAELERFLAEVCTGSFNAELDAGRPFEEACTELARRHPAHSDLVHAWKRQADMVAGEVTGAGALVERLAARRVPLYLLTNMPRWVFDERVAAYPTLQRFRGAVVSGDEGILKPDPQIYKLVLSRFELAAQETLFIDDRQPNVDAAAALGFATHQFRNAPDLEAALTDLGLL